MISDVTWGIPSTPQVDQINRNRARRDWRLKTECHVINNCVEHYNYQTQRCILSPYASLMESHMMSCWIWQHRQPFSLYLVKDHMLVILMHQVLNLVDLFHVLIHSALTVQPCLRSAFACLCSVHIRCLDIMLEDNCAFLNMFWEEESVSNIDSSPSYSPYICSKQCKTM